LLRTWFLPKCFRVDNRRNDDRDGKAANDLDTFIANRPVSCLPISLDRYGRTAATCAVGGADLGDWLVHDGLALGLAGCSDDASAHS
jgi:endonuclease YncB( thermonuclease family)